MKEQQKVIEDAQLKINEINDKIARGHRGGVFLNGKRTLTDEEEQFALRRNVLAKWDLVQNAKRKYDNILKELKEHKKKRKGEKKSEAEIIAELAEKLARINYNVILAEYQTIIIEQKKYNVKQAELVKEKAKQRKKYRKN